MVNMLGQVVYESFESDNTFNIELENLRNSVLTMGGEVEQQLLDTLKALKLNHPGLAEKVVLVCS